MEPWKHLHLKGQLESISHNLIILLHAVVVKLMKRYQYMRIRYIVGTLRNQREQGPFVSPGTQGELPGGIRHGAAL